MERTDKYLILAKIEGTYNTDPTPAAATEVLVAMDAAFEVTGSVKERKIPLSYFGNIAPKMVGEALKLTFKTELKGSGTAGTASRYSPLLKACGFTEAVSVGVSVTYTPNSTFLGSSVAFYFHIDGTLHKLLGGVGNAKFIFKAQEIPMIEWEFTCMYLPGHATTVTFPAPTHEAISPLIWKAANFTYNSVSLVIDELSMDMGNDIGKRTDGNATNGINRFFIKQRNSKGTMKVEKEPLATLNPWAFYDASTQANIAHAPTGTAGNTIAIAVTGVTLDVPKYSDRENVLMWDLPFSINPTLSAGNNEIVITMT